MHVIFIPYGRIELVEKTLNDIRAQKYLLKLTSPDKKETADMWIEGQLRVLPFAFYEHVFPVENLDIVLNTLGDKSERYQLSKTKLAMIRSVLHAKPIPEFKTDKKLLWVTQDVHIILIGIREDVMDLPDDLLAGKYKGWSHEAI